MSRPPKEFVDWCRTPTETVGTKFDLSAQRQQRRAVQPRPNDWEAAVIREFFEEVNQKIKNDTNVELLINRNLHGVTPTIRREHLSYNNEIAAIRISDTTVQSLTLEYLAIRLFQLSTSTPEPEITIKNSSIKRLEIGACKSITLINSQIGTLAIRSASIYDFDMRGGSILDVECRPPWEASPFVGSVSLVDVFLPRDPHNYLIKGPQPYRNLRAHLRRLENSQGANLIHSAELAMERETDSNTNKFLSHVYERFSDFGASALRPLVWLFAFWLVSFLAIYSVDGAALALPSGEYTGWRAVLACEDRTGEVWRALVLSLQQMASPLTVLGAKPLLVPKHWPLVVWSVIHSLLSVVLLALFILAVRRRFKMQ